MIKLNKKTLDRIRTIRLADEKVIKQKEAAEQLGITTRQVRRLMASYRQKGEAGLLSGHYGNTNNKLSDEVRQQAVSLIQQKYPDFGPTLACEQLYKRHQIQLSVETVRQLMIGSALWTPHKTKEKPVHQRRERRPCYGELIQIDGSIHDWFEGRAPACTLLVFIDDATGQLLYLQFVQTESTASYMEALSDYLDGYGRPVSFYSDSHSVFRVNKGDKTSLTQFGRALKLLGIDAIFAGTPQAKGRVERVNRTLQDRLIKELRLEGIDSMEEANHFLEQYRETFNRQFSVIPASSKDAHRPVMHTKQELALILSKQTPRKISKELEVQYHNRIYQIQASSSYYALRKETVTVCEAFNGEVTLLYQNKVLPYKVLEKSQIRSEIVNEKTVNFVVDSIIQKQKVHSELPVSLESVLWATNPVFSTQMNLGL